MAQDSITALIVDDEEEARDLTANLLLGFPEIEIISKESNVDDAITTIIAHNPDIVFLDIDMPDKDGFVLIDEIRKLSLTPTIIFITAFNRAVEAFEQDAFDYLMKPIDPDRLRKTINRYKIEKQHDSFDDRYEKLQTILNHNKIRINTRAGFVLLDTEKIVYCEAQGNYTEVMFENGIKETITKQIGQLEELLTSSTFIRISRSAVINLKYLNKINRKSKTCELFINGKTHTLEASREQLKIIEGMEF